MTSKHKKHAEQVQRTLDLMRFADGVTWKIDRHRCCEVKGHDDFSHIRAAGSGQEMCPLTAWFAHQTRLGIIPPIDDWRAAAKAMGIPVDVAAEIVAAADDQEDHDPNVRKQLLEKCGLNEDVAT